MAQGRRHGFPHDMVPDLLAGGSRSRWIRGSRRSPSDLLLLVVCMVDLEMEYSLHKGLTVRKYVI
jgi:hypothetical protein